MNKNSSVSLQMVAIFGLCLSSSLHDVWSMIFDRNTTVLCSIKL